MSDAKTNSKDSKVQSSVVLAWVRGIAGAAIGGLLGYLMFDFLLGYGLYAGIVPGAFIGIGFSIAARHISLVAGVLCGIVGLFFGFWCDAVTNLPPDDLVSYFKEIDQVPTVNLLMIVIGGVASFWFGRGRNL